MERIGKLKVCCVIALASCVALVAAACSSGSAQSGSSTSEASPKQGMNTSSAQHITVEYSENIADYLPIWIAKDEGYFTKNGLDVSLKEVTSKTAIQVLLSNEAQIGVFGGSLVLSAAAQGANLRYFATLTPVVTFSLYAQPRYASAAKLRGQRVGVSSTGGSNYAGGFLGLKALGLSPSDVNIASLGSSSNVDSALLSGTIAAGVGHPPAAAKFRAKGLVELVDLVKKKIPFAFVGISARTKFASSHKDVVRAFLVGLLQGIHREKSDKSLAEREIRKHFDLSKQKNLDSVYDYYAKRVVPNVPRVSRAQFETEIEIFSGQNPDIKSVNLDKVINKSYLASAVKEANRTK